MTQKISGSRPTMTDIAKLANVSQSTVSLVINNLSGAKVSKKTRELVLKVAADLGYPVARRLHQSSEHHERNLILYLTDELSTSPHPVQSIDGANDIAWDHDCLVAVFPTKSNAEHEAAVLSRMLGNPALVGIIYATIFTRQVTPPSLLHSVPTVLLNCHASERSHSSVVPAELLGGYSATMHLIEHGHKRIGFINGEPWMEAARERFKGYKQALSSSDLPFDPSLVKEGDWNVGTGFDHTISLLASKSPPTAIFCANDQMAVGALDAVHHLNLRVPQDVSVIGYDDQPMARYSHPLLTTMLLPNYEMGRWAAQTLIEQAPSLWHEGGAAVRKTAIKMDCPLVERQSVAAPPA